MDKRLALALIAVIFVNGVLAAPPRNQTEKNCSSIHERCLVTEDCCKNLVCLGYLARCVVLPGLHPLNETQITDAALREALAWDNEKFKAQDNMLKAKDESE